MKTSFTTILMTTLLGAVCVDGLEPLNEGGTPRGDCSNFPGSTDVKLDWRGQNLAGCKVELVSTRSRIHRVRSDCMTIYYGDLPPEVPRQWTILSQPPGANAQVMASGNSATLTLPLPGDYTLVGSSRVDLQACKLEYSIVSPK